MSLTLSDIDAHAIQLTQPETDSDIFEFDLTLWNIISSLAKKNGETVKRQFGFCEESLLAVASASDSALARLASGVLIGFRLETSEVVIMELLKQKYAKVIQLNRDSGGEFDSAYWLLLKACAIRRGSQHAAAVFGVSPLLAEAVEAATDNQLRYLASNTVTAFTLRFSPRLLKYLIGAQEKAQLAHLFFVKFQQSMTSGGFKQSRLSSGGRL